MNTVVLSSVPNNLFLKLKGILLPFWDNLDGELKPQVEILSDEQDFGLNQLKAMNPILFNAFPPFVFADIAELGLTCT